MLRRPLRACTLSSSVLNSTRSAPSTSKECCEQQHFAQWLMPLPRKSWPSQEPPISSRRSVSAKLQQAHAARDPAAPPVGDDVDGAAAGGVLGEVRVEERVEVRVVADDDREVAPDLGVQGHGADALAVRLAERGQQDVLVLQRGGGFLGPAHGEGLHRAKRGWQEEGGASPDSRVGLSRISPDQSVSTRSFSNRLCTTSWWTRKSSGSRGLLRTPSSARASPKFCPYSAVRLAAACTAR